MLADRGRGALLEIEVPFLFEDLEFTRSFSRVSRRAHPALAACVPDRPGSPWQQPSSL